MKPLTNPLTRTNLADNVYRPNPKTPVTIIIGIICESAIVLASDSQTTYSNSLGANRRMDTPKISILEFEDGEAFVAESGDATLSGRAVEILSRMAKGTKLSDYRTVADLSQKAIRQVKDELREQNFDCSMAELREYMMKSDLNFSLMLAHYHNGKPYIYTVDFALGIATLSTHSYAAIGCGRGLALYILDWFNLGPETYFSEATMAAMYAVEEVKKVDSNCGGKTRVGIISAKMIPPPGKTRLEMLQLMLENDNEEYVNALAQVDKEAKLEWAKRMRFVLAAGNKAMDARAAEIKLKKNATN